MTEETIAWQVVYVGRRWNGPKVTHAWVPADNLTSEMYFDKLKGAAVGGIYTVQSPVGPKEKQTVYPSTLTFIGKRLKNDAQVALWQAADRQTGREQQLQAAERKYAKSGPLDDAMEPLLDLARTCRTRAQANALRNAVSERIDLAFWKERS